MKNKARILIVGGSSSIAEHCVRHWLKQTDAQLVLLGRNLDRLQRVALDLKVRYPDADLDLVTTDFLNPSTIQETIDRLFQHGAVDIALIAHGNLPDQEQCQLDLNSCKQAIDVNALSPVLFAEAIVKQMIAKNHGKLAVIGSVAGDRGRKSNYIYGASKALIATYVQGLQHRLALTGSAVTASLIKPGPTQTPMTAGLAGKGKLASPDQVAVEIVRGIEKGRATIYTPAKWALIMLVIRNLPFWLFRKMDI